MLRTVNVILDIGTRRREAHRDYLDADTWMPRYMRTPHARCLAATRQLHADLIGMHCQDTNGEARVCVAQRPQFLETTCVEGSGGITVGKVL
jgi:hypothetical protein